MAIKLISFDLDDTLWLNDGIIENAQSKMFEAIDEVLISEDKAPSALSHEIWAEIAQATRDQYPELAHDMTALRKQALQDFLHSQGILDAATLQLYVEQIFHALWFERIQVKPFSDVEPLLKDLKSNYLIAALTNGNACLKYLKLDHLFDWHLQPADTGYAKPHPKMFEYLFSKAGVAPSECLHIGDHPLEDMKAAADLGCQVIWANYKNKPWPQGFMEQPNTIYTLSELKSLI